jgi:nicotinate-nucleotide adenylyltransferase
VRLGVFGGTFDPPHIGHLIAAQDSLERLQLDRIRFVPAAIPPHKQSSAGLTPASLRRALVRAAVAGDPRFEVDPLELERAGPSFTVDTLRLLHERLPDARLVLLIGADQYAEFDTWQAPDAIRRLARIAVLTRTGSPRPDGDVPIEHVAVTRIDVSSTEIRRRVAAGESIRYLVPRAVEAIIRSESLYAVPSPR